MRRSCALAAAGLVAGCSAQPAPTGAASASPTPSATVAAPRTLVAADFAPDRLGGRVAGIEVTDAAAGGGKAPLARLSAYVACGATVTVCDPAQLPADTVYTYVLTVTPSPAPEPTPSSTDTGTVLAAPTELVSMTRAAAGFNGAVGFARAEAVAALGADDALTVTLDGGRLIWRVTGGSGWQAGKPLTLWWQSTLRPGKATAHYRLEYGGRQADLHAPFPAADKPVEDAPQR